jgi:LmbE family N-acetylglucosaminyl deacetylase
MIFGGAHPGTALVVATRPDDEALGCGGTMAALAPAGLVVKVAFLADGFAREACARLSAEIFHLGSFPDNRLDTVALLDIVQVVEAAVLTACRPVTCHPVSTILSFEVNSSTEWLRHHDAQPGFAPDLFVDIAATLGAEFDAPRSYGAEMRPWQHPRSFEAVEHLARWRAVVGLEVVEALKVRHLVVRA